MIDFLATAAAGVALGVLGERANRTLKDLSRGQESTDEWVTQASRMFMGMGQATLPEGPPCKCGKAGCESNNEPTKTELDGTNGNYI